MELWTNQRSSTRNKEMCPDMASMIWIPASPQRRRQRWCWACLLRQRWALAARPLALRRRRAASVLFLLSFPESLQHLGLYFAVLSHLHTSRGPWGNQPIGEFQKSILITFYPDNSFCRTQFLSFFRQNRFVSSLLCVNFALQHIWTAKLK